MNWPMVALGELCEITVGRTPARNNQEFWGPGEPWLSIADMNQGLVIRDTKEQITPVAAKAGKVVAEGTVLLSFKLSIGKVAIAGRPLYTNEAIAALPIRANNRVLPEYLLRALQSLDLAAGANRAAMGSTLNKAQLQQLYVPVPPLVDQRKIAEILDRVDALRAKRRLVISLLDTLTRSLYVSEFGNPMAASPSHRPLAEVGEIITGNSPSRTNPLNFGEGIEWIKSDNLGDIIATIADERLSTAGEKIARVAPLGAVLVTCIAGSPSSIGKSSLVDRRVAFNQQINAFIPSQSVEGRFILEQLRVAPDLVRQQSTGGMKGLVNKSSFGRIRVQVPDLRGQRAFVAQAKLVDDVKTRGRAALAELDDLFSTLQSRLIKPNASTNHG